MWRRGLETLLGPLIHKAHQITAASLVRALPFLKRVVRQAPSLHLSRFRVEIGIGEVLKEHPRLIAVGQVGSAQANAISNHYMHAAKFVRQMRRENDTHTEDARSNQNSSCNPLTRIMPHEKVKVLCLHSVCVARTYEIMMLCQVVAHVSENWRGAAQTVGGRLGARG